MRHGMTYVTKAIELVDYNATAAIVTLLLASISLATSITAFLISLRSYPRHACRDRISSEQFDFVWFGSYSDSIRCLLEDVNFTRSIVLVGV
jgi:hypothetical protein